jgi:hypothetical protein
LASSAAGLTVLTPVLVNLYIGYVISINTNVFAIFVSAPFDIIYMIPHRPI